MTASPTRTPPASGPLERLRLRPELEVLWRSTGELQLGSDPRTAVRLEGLAPHETRWLSTTGDKPLLASAARAGVDRARARDLVAALERAGVTSRPRRSAPVTAPGAGAGDAPALGAVHARPGHEVLERRAERSVLVAGTGRTGAGVAQALAAAGVGTLLLHDARPVLGTDVGVGGLVLADVGRRRDAAVAAHVAASSPATAVRTGADATSGDPDLVVLVSHRAPDVARATRLVGAGTDHLAVVIEEAGAVVGPLVVPGRGPCLRCVDLHHRDADSRWPTMAVQLRQRYEGAAAPEETVTATTAAALAAGQVLAHLDGLPTTALAASLEVRLPAAVPRIRRWHPHPRCGCHSLEMELEPAPVPPA
ncbi:thiamine biosynthesis protein ThiF [Luteimicrobium sp. DT211]|uniref:thiamine biosynthesis protein ThiF n=1 Tax=Luteimicrobium sp. DT211 TaxID=3393412 RepID=UPI003CE68B54